MLRTGGLDFAPRESAIPLDSYSESMRAAGVPFEHLDAGEIMRRWPQFRLSDDIHGLFQEQSGIAMAARANATHQRMAREHGATLRDRVSVTAVRAAGGEVDIQADGVTYMHGGWRSRQARGRTTCSATSDWSYRSR